MGGWLPRCPSHSKLTPLQARIAPVLAVILPQKNYPQHLTLEAQEPRADHWTLKMGGSSIRMHLINTIRQADYVLSLPKWP